MYSFSYSCILFRWDSPYHKILQDITGLPAQPFQQFNTGARSTAQRQAERETGTGNGKYSGIEALGNTPSHAGNDSFEINGSIGQNIKIHDPRFILFKMKTMNS